MRILLVEDERPLAKEISDFLQSEHHVVDVVSSKKMASENLAVNSYDFALVDLGLPDGDGLDLLQDVSRYQKDASVIILTARTEVGDKILGLESGADDYLSKPFSLLELKARMQAILRRKSGWRKDVIQLGGFEIHLNEPLVAFEGQEIKLTKKEYILLQFMLINKNRVLNRFQLAEHLWGDQLDDEYQSNYIDVHVKNIRKKLSAFGPVEWLETVRGLGYKLIA
ncbi:response regulator transcription factor [Algoriphagus aquatilis]|uniref:Response regulator transcription factor n=1 Tax=Algoriphagus aquatilis TaxID=490186 RepID=A0ABW0BW47_9BACT